MICVWEIQYEIKKNPCHSTFYVIQHNQHSKLSFVQQYNIAIYYNYNIILSKLCGDVPVQSFTEI